MRTKYHWGGIGSAKYCVAGGGGIPGRSPFPLCETVMRHEFKFFIPY